MSRVTFTTYCERRTNLRQAWKGDHDCLLGLSATEQWTLHEYYRFAESLTKDQIREHWTQQHANRSSFPQRAGRAYAAFELVLASKPARAKVPAQPVARKRRRDVTFRVQPIVHPHPDSKKLARLLLEIFRKDQER